MKGLREVGPNPVTKAYLIALMVPVDPGILNVNNILSEYSCKNIILRLKKLHFVFVVNFSARKFISILSHTKRWISVELL